MRVDDVFAALGTIPALPGARCRGRAHLFDGSDGLRGERTRQAAQLCSGCPSLDRCRDWTDRQPDNTLHGVFAGRLFTYVSHASMRRNIDGCNIRRGNP